MAALVPTAAQVELIQSLSQDDIPIKLRCAICSKLAVNAFRLPCCDQAICETCQPALPSHCPVCEHTPVAAEDCKPNKSLRTTIRVFLRTEEKKREALRIKDQKETPPVTPLEAEIPVTHTPAVPGTPITEVKDEPVVEPPTALANIDATVEDSENTDVPETAATETQQDIPQQSIEEIAPGQEETADGVDATEDGQDGQHSADGLKKDDSNAQAVTGMAQTPAFGMGFGFDPTTAAGFPGMGMMSQGGDFNQMQMMMAMQNGMAPGAFGGFPMGMPGMSMDPMAMQQMFMNGGFGAQGMGMNGINMGMGMGGFDDGTGTGYNNGWNGQQWNIGQDNFNQPNATGMGHGDFGANNSGFNHQNAAGFNQGNFGSQNQYNDFQQNGYGQQNQGYYGRGRGRGRGYGYGQGRGGHGYGNHVPFSPQYSQNGSAQPPNGPMSETGSIPTGPKADSASMPPSNVDEFGREIRPTSEAQDNDGEAGTNAEGNAGSDDAENVAPTAETSTAEHAVTSAEKDDMPKPIQSVADVKSSTLPSGFSTNGFANVQSIGTFDSNWAGQGNYHNQAGAGMMLPPQAIHSIVAVPDIPINAPKGPKAMRDGLPNTSVFHLRGRGGFGNAGRGGFRTNGVSSVEQTASTETAKSPTPEKQSQDKERERSRSRSRSHTQSGSPARSERSGSYERRKERHRERKRHRHRSTSRSEDEEEKERRRERRRRRHRRYEDDYDEKADIIEGETKTNGDDNERSRDHSPAESRRSSHRSRKDREKDDDGGERDHKSSSSHKHRSSHRSHHSRSPHRSHRDRDRERDRSRHRDRSRDRNRERSREHRNRRRHDSTEPSKPSRTRDPSPAAQQPVSESTKEELKIPRGPKAMSLASVVASNTASNGIGIKGSARRQSVQDDRGRSTKDRERSSRHSRDEHQTTSTSTSNPKAAPQAPAERSKAAKKEIADPHTLEREARNRERLLKEAQRIAGLSSGGAAARKRSRDEDGASHRKRGRRSEAEAREGGLEERIARGESEREAGRWG